MATRQIISKNINVASGAYTGKDGEMWVDTDTNVLKISDGTTAGGVTITTDGGGGGGLTWASLTNIDNANGPSKIVIGLNAGGAGARTIAIGQQAGKTTQSDFAVAIGNLAGETSQGAGSVAVGYYAGNATQGNSTVAIGDGAGKTTQSQHGVAIGAQAGQTTQGASSVAIGKQAGRDNQGSSAVAIGNLAGLDNQHNNSIVIAASGSALNTAQTGQFMVKPVRGVAGTLPTGFSQVAYNPTTGEFISYG